MKFDKKITDFQLIASRSWQMYCDAMKELGLKIIEQNPYKVPGDPVSFNEMIAAEMQKGFNDYLKRHQS